MSEHDRKKIKKEQLMQMLLDDEIPQMADLTTAIKELTKLVENFRKAQEEDSLVIVKMKTEVELLKDENRTLRRDLTSRINDLEQRSRINNIQIVGLRKPTLMETDAVISVNFLNETVNAEVEMGEIEALHEVPSRRKDGKRIVIVHFKSRAKRDKILADSKQALREYNKNLEADKRVYINEHLSPGNKKLFAMATKKNMNLVTNLYGLKMGLSF